jgi:hypothetical protein
MYPGIATAGRRQKIKQIVLDGENAALGGCSVQAKRFKSRLEQQREPAKAKGPSRRIRVTAILT